jgi:hypothetical protein
MFRQNSVESESQIVDGTTIAEVMSPVIMDRGTFADAIKLTTPI